MFVVVLWLVFVAWAVWRHVQISEQPLVYDAITYWLKARNLWGEIAQGHFVNPFNIDPTTRPPGTVLMSYPFGFDASVKGFLFRSIFLGIALTVAAVLVVTLMPPRNAHSWNVACVALFAAALPMFYHFEYSGVAPSYWGLTDSFLAGLSALACAAAILGATRRSWGWTALAALLASVAFLTKPAGLLVMAAVIGTWFIFAVAAGSAAQKRLRLGSGERRTLYIAAIVFAGLCGPVVLAGFRSSYFSDENFKFGDGALRELMENWATPPLHSLIQTSFGYGPIIALAACVIAGLYWLRTANRASAYAGRALIVAGLLATTMHMTAGLWFFVIKTGGSQIRYFYPFALMAMISVLPLAFSILDAASPKTQAVVRALLLALPLNLTILLAQWSPSSEWQRITGVTLAAHPAGPDFRLGLKALEAVRQQGAGATIHSVYSASLETTGEIDSLWIFERRAHPDLPNFGTTGPIDWQRSTTFRLREIGAARFILFFPIRDPRERERRLGMASVDSYPAEKSFFEAWLSGLGEQDGVQVFGETDRARLLKVVDPGRLERTLDTLRRSRKWRPVFEAANPQMWWSAEEVSTRFAGQSAAASDVGFGGFFRIAALSLRREGDNVQVEFWWDKNKAAPPGNWFFFAHAIDASGAMVVNASVPLTENDSYSPQAPLRFDSLSIQVPAISAAKAVAFGIYRAEADRADTLVADSGNRDWNNRRVVVPLP
jgi:hypothetical protein